MPTHFRDLVRLRNWLQQHRFDHLVYGGWALDALLGMETREHDDVDLFLHFRDRPRFRELLTAEALEVELDAPYKIAWRGPVVGAGYVETHFMQELGDVMVLGYPKDWIRVPLAGLHPKTPATLYGETFDVVCPEVLVCMNNRWGRSRSDQLNCGRLGLQMPLDHALMNAVVLKDFYTAALLE